MVQSNYPDLNQHHSFFVIAIIVRSPCFIAIVIALHIPPHSMPSI